MYGTCKECQKSFRTQEAFITHPCVKRIMRELEENDKKAKENNE